MRLWIIPLFFMVDLIVTIHCADIVGAWPILLWLVLALFLGLNMIRAIGVSSVMGMAQDIKKDREPGQLLLDGLLKMVAAVLFIIPGVLSDVLALLCLIPWVRYWVLRRFLARLSTNAVFYSQGFNYTGPGGNVYEHQGSARAQPTEVDNAIDHKPDSDHPPH